MRPSLTTSYSFLYARTATVPTLGTYTTHDRPLTPAPRPHGHHQRPEHRPEEHLEEGLPVGVRTCASGGISRGGARRACPRRTGAGLVQAGGRVGAELYHIHELRGDLRIVYLAQFLHTRGWVSARAEHVRACAGCPGMVCVRGAQSPRCLVALVKKSQSCGAALACA